MSTAFETTQTAARVYAEALLSLASERGSVDELESELRELMTLWREDSMFAALMSSAAIDDDARRASLRRIFAGRVNELVLNLMLVLNDKGRSMIFPQVVDAFERILDAHRGRQRVWVTTAVEMTDEQRKRAAEVARKIGGKEPVLVERVDASILGGAIVQVGDRVLDDSLRLRLRRMRSELHRTMDGHLIDAGQRFVKA